MIKAAPGKASLRLTRGDGLRYYLRPQAEVAEPADARDSKSREGNLMGVRPPPSALIKSITYADSIGGLECGIAIYFVHTLSKPFSNATTFGWLALSEFA
jgi:hypothetical protein